MDAMCHHGATMMQAAAMGSVRATHSVERMLLLFTDVTVFDITDAAAMWCSLVPAWRDAYPDVITEEDAVEAVRALLRGMEAWCADDDVRARACAAARRYIIHLDFMLAPPV
jgi:hypothetical protein